MKIRSDLLKWALGFVIIVAGVVTGSIIANRIGLAKNIENQDRPPVSVLSVLHEGELFPDISVLAKDSNTIRLLDTIESGSGLVLVVFASSGCLPCHEFLQDLAALSHRNVRMKVILLVDHADNFEQFPQFLIFEITPKLQAELELRVFPTYCELTSDGTIRKVWVFYNPNNPPEFMQE